MSSFASERTIEYSLVPLLKGELRRGFGSVVPLFPWMNREAGSASFAAHKGWHGRVLALFVRRPKLDSPGVVRAQIGADLFEFATRARQLGIPTLAALPVVDSLISLAGDPQILWWTIASCEPEDLSLKIRLSDGLVTSWLGSKASLEPVHSEEIARCATERCELLSWAEAMMSIRSLRNMQQPLSGSARWPWWGGYRPVYFLIGD